jgi:UDP-glucose 4-epimerase
MSKKVLVTGNAGYIGGHLTNILRRRKKYQVWGLDYDQPQIEVYDHLNGDIRIIPRLDFAEFDTVIHLAALVNVGESVRDPLNYYRTNIAGTENVLSKIKYKNFVFASTGAAAGMASPYGISKKAAEDIVAQHCQEESIPYTIFRFYNVIGSDGVAPTNPDGLMLNLINARKTGEFNIFGNDYNTTDGTAIRDYVHVNEICHALIEAIERPANGIENLGHGQGHSVLEMVDLFKQVNKVDFKVKFGPRRSGDLECSVLDSPSAYLPNLYSINDLLKI